MKKLSSKEKRQGLWLCNDEEGDDDTRSGCGQDQTVRCKLAEEQIAHFEWSVTANIASSV